MSLAVKNSRVSVRLSFIKQDLKLVDPKAMDNFVQEELARTASGEALRWAITRVENDTIYSSGTLYEGLFAKIEATFLDGSTLSRTMPLPEKRIGEKTFPKNLPIFVHIVPTGYKAAIGGSLGDAMPVNLALSQLGLLVTHPNTCNGGLLNFMDVERMLYVEGYALDHWAKGSLHLAPSCPRTIGIIIDRAAAELGMLNRIKNFINGFRAHTGVSTIAALTDAPMGGIAKLNESGAFVGDIPNIESVIHAARRLIKKGVNCLAVFSYIKIEKTQLTDYLCDTLPNPYGGTEAIISHTLTRLFGIPAAHAPILPPEESHFLEGQCELRPQAAAEAAAPHYLWSVLRGLSYTPQLISPRARIEPGHILPFTNVSAVICPASAMGGIPMMRADMLGIPIIGIRENTTVSSVFAKDLGFNNVIEVYDYLEALGLLKIAMQSGEFEKKNLNIFAAALRNDLRNIGSAICEEFSIDPATLRRPIPPTPFV